MKEFKLFVASLAVTCLAIFPATAKADPQEELDVTMEVLDSVADIDGNVLEMRGPEPEEDDLTEEGEDHGGEPGEQIEEEVESEEEPGDGMEGQDGFEHDEDFESGEDEEHFEQESDFDEGDEVDTDEPDIEEDHEEEPMEEPTDEIAEEDVVADGEDDFVVEEPVEGEPGTDDEETRPAT